MDQEEFNTPPESPVRPQGRTREPLATVASDDSNDRVLTGCAIQSLCPLHRKRDLSGCAIQSPVERCKRDLLDDPCQKPGLAIQSPVERCTGDLLDDPSAQKHFSTTEMSGGVGNDDNDKAVGDLTSTIHEKITQGTQKTKSFFSSACICRVPKNLRRLNNSAYTPHLISIGPLHQNDKHLKKTPMLQVKLFYSNYLFLRLTEGIVDQEKKANKKLELLQDCVKEMKKSIDDARKSYAEDVMLDEEMMVVDGCFILELLYNFYDLVKQQGKKPTNGGGNSEASSSIQQPQEGEDSSKSSSRKQEMEDPIFGNILTNNIVKHDLLLLENQIPFFVLEKLFKLTVKMIPNRPHKLSLVDYVLFYFRDTMSPEDNTSNDCVIDFSGDKTNYNHILHLLHDNYLTRGKQKVKKQTSPTLESGQKTKFSEFTLSASNLEYAGVRFKALSRDNPFDMNFIEKEGLYWWCRRARFYIPTIGIHDSTEPFLRNLIAFEQCCPRVSQYFTSYAFLMDMLINSETDVQVLKDAEVISNYLGADEDISNLFNKLCKEVVLEKFYFDDTCSKAFNYSKYHWPKIMAYLKRTFFSSPWAFTGFCLAFIAFAMSVIQFGWSFHT